MSPQGRLCKLQEGARRSSPAPSHVWSIECVKRGRGFCSTRTKDRDGTKKEPPVISVVSRHTHRNENTDLGCTVHLQTGGAEGMLQCTDFSSRGPCLISCRSPSELEFRSGGEGELRVWQPNSNTKTHTWRRTANKTNPCLFICTALF